MEQDSASANKDAGTVVLRQYVLGPPLDWDEGCERELRLQTDLWNKLIEIERHHRKAFFELTADDPAVQETEAALKDGLDRLAELRKKRARMRSDKRKKGDTKDLDEAIRVALEEAKARVAAAREARRLARENIKPKIKALNDARFVAVKVARNSSGLWWGNYNAVCASYEHGRTAALKRGGELHFRRWNGEGRITNQIQGGITVAELFSGAHSQVELLKAGHLPARKPGSRRNRVERMILSATAFTRDGVRKNVRWPIFIGRPLPDDATVKDVVIHRRKISHRVRWTATFTCRQPMAATKTQSVHTIAINLGWRRMNDGIRVATVMDNNGGHEFLMLNGVAHERTEKDLVGVHDWIDDQKQHRDALHAKIVDVLRMLPWPAAPAPLAAAAQWWCAVPAKRLVARHTVKLILAWRGHADWRPDDFAAADEWRRHDKRIWERISYRSDRARRERLDFYRKTAKRLVSGTGVVILEDFRLDRIAKKRADNLPNAANEAIQRNRAIAGVSVLRHWIELEAAKVGAVIHIHSGVSTWLCSVCGQRLKPRDPARLHQQCPHCNSHPFDQDLEACRNMLAAYHASAAMATARG
jgi:rubrerythrin